MKFSELTRMSNHPRTSNRPARLEEIGLLDFTGDKEADLSSPRYDSRDVKPGDAFFAIRGFATDGHEYIKQAIARGATTIVLEEASAFTSDDATSTNVNRIVVQNSRRALGLISEEAFGNPSEKLRMIGVTGTNGKTTVTHLIKQLLEANGEKTGIIGTVGIQIGDSQIEATHTTPESRDISEMLARMVKEGVTTCVMEVSSHALALDRVFALDYDIAAFTNITQDHLDFHHTMEEYFAAKRKLFDSLKDTAVAVTNADDPLGLAIVANSAANSHSFGITNPADLVASDIQLSIDRSEFVIQKRYSEEKASVRSNLIGSFNVENVLAAMGALYFGVPGYSLSVLADLMRNVGAVRGRFEALPLTSGATAIIDYAHTPDALEKVLTTIRALKPNGKITTVFGCGGDRDRLKRPQMGHIAAKLSDKVIVTSDNPRTEDSETIISEILQGIPPTMGSETTVEPDRSRAIEMAISNVTADEIVLVAGKGHETYQVIGKEKHHFDDREEVTKYDNTR